jgi:hypothetical protein
MAVTYIRRFNLKDGLDDAEVAAFWKVMLEELVPALARLGGTRSVRFYSGAGALRADLRMVWDIDHAGVCEQALQDPGVQPLISRLYRDIDLKTSTHTVLREVTAARLLAA